MSAYVLNEGGDDMDGFFDLFEALLTLREIEYLVLLGLFWRLVKAVEKSGPHR